MLPCAFTKSEIRAFVIKRINIEHASQCIIGSCAAVVSGDIASDKCKEKPNQAQFHILVYVISYRFILINICGSL